MAGTYYAPERLSKPQRDALIAIYYGIDMAIDEVVIKNLEARLLVVAKHPKGWMCTSTGLEYVRRLK
jgi:hypothetical protein